MRPDGLIGALDRRLSQRAGWLVLASLMMLAALPARLLDRLYGDEYTYTAVARVIADFLRAEADHAALVRALVGDGHFMPGPSLLASPLYLAIPDPAVWHLRLWWGAVMVLLWLWTVAETRRHLGPAFALAAVLFPAAMISWHMMAATVTGDVAAGLLLLIAFARTYGVCMALLDGGRLPLRAVLAWEVVLALMIVMRGPTILAAGALHAAIIGAALIGRRHPARWALTLLCGIALLLATLSPWMLATKRVLGEPLLTTSTLPLSLGYTFGDRERLCFGRCPSGNIWHVMPEFSRQEARRLGVSALEVQRRMAANALEGLTAEHYFDTVRGNVLRFVTSPTGIGERLIEGSFAMPDRLKPILRQVLLVYDWPIYAVFLMALLAANLLIVRRTLEHQVISLGIKLMTLAIFVQPFTHPSHGRYWPVFAPLMALSAGLLLILGTRRTDGKAPGIGLFTVMQSGHVAIIVAVAFVLVVA